MTNKGWEEAGRLARLRRERLGLKQEDLQLYGGPKVATVGKFERAAQDNFPLRTQHQIENALGWSRGTIEDILKAAVEDDWETMWKDDYEETLIEDNIPDLSSPTEPAETQVRRAAELSDDELLAELTYRLKRYAAALEGATPAQGDRAADMVLRDGDGNVTALVEAKTTPTTPRARQQQERQLRTYLTSLLHETGDDPKAAMILNLEHVFAEETDLETYATANLELTQLFAARKGQSVGRAQLADHATAGQGSQDPGGMEPA